MSDPERDRIDKNLRRSIETPGAVQKFGERLAQCAPVAEPLVEQLRDVSGEPNRRSVRPAPVRVKVA